MKKFISVIAAATLSLCALFSGCSCIGEETLSFTIDAKKSETLTYSVTLQDNYLGNFTKSDKIDGAFSYEYDTANAKFVTALSRRFDLTGITSDIIDDVKVDKTVYAYTVEFEIPLTITAGDAEYHHLEKITTTALIADAGVSLAPIYAKEETEYFDISATATKTAVRILKSETETFYTTEKVTVKSKYKFFDATKPLSEITLDGVTATETTRDYVFRTAIDNAEMLFALRALSLEESASATLRVLSPSYSEATPIKVTNTAKSSGNFYINGTSKKITYDTLNFYVNNTNASGIPQYVKVQSDANGENPLLLEYAKPLVCAYDGSYVSMGWLIFTLSTAE